MFFLHVVYQTLQVEQRGFALNTCQEANGVSWLHGEVSKRMFQGVWKGYDWRESHVGYVTNGVHMPTWAASEWKAFYTEKLGQQVFANQSDPEAWKGIFSVDDEEIWNMRVTMKNKFVNFAAHVHEVLPADAEFCRVFAHVFAEETFVEIVVPGGYGGVDGVER